MKGGEQRLIQLYSDKLDGFVMARRVCHVDDAKLVCDDDAATNMHIMMGKVFSSLLTSSTDVIS